MRSDMAKVVTERPRRGSDWKSVKTAKKLDPRDYDHFEYDGEFICDDSDDGPRRYPVSRRGQCKYSEGHDCKDFSDLLGPLRKYLRKQVGRRWDDVYSEMNQSLDKRSLTGIHIWDHVKWEIETKCWLGVDGKVYNCKPYLRAAEVTGLYVHPHTGIICWTPERSWNVRRRNRPKEEQEEIKLTDNTSLCREKGIWYHVTTTVVDVSYTIPCHFEQAVYRSGHMASKPHFVATRTVKDHRVTRLKKQLSRKELRDYKLQNSPITKKD